MNYNEFLDSFSSSYKNLLSRLTSASSELPPGYLYNELVEFVRTNPSKLNEIEEYLINKLSRKEPYVKLKCLKLLKHLCIKFPKDFIRPKVTQSHLVLECKNFKSPHSEYLGDNLTKLVRTECEELVKVVCSYDSNSNNNFGQPENKMVGFGNNQHSNYSQGGNYTSPGMGNPNYQTPSYNTYQNRNRSGYGNTGMMGFGNPNMPPQNPNTSGFATFASTFTPTVSELKTAGNNALKMLGNVANKYLPSDFVEKIEKVSSAITTTATEQFEKYLGNRTPLGRNDPRNLNNSMYSTRGQPNQYTGGFGYNTGHNPTQSGYGPSQGGYSLSQGYSGGGYNSTAYNAPLYSNPQTYSNPQFYSQPPQPYNNPPPYSSSLNYSNAQAFASQQPVSNSPSFSNSRNTSVSSTYNQGFGAFPTQPGPVHQPPVSSLSHTSSVEIFNPPKEPSIDLFTPTSNKSTVKYTMSGERETAFVREMLTFTGIKVSPSPKLIEEYIVRMKDMDKGLVVSELMKHLNMRSAKWQTHFRILCLLESLVLKGNLDEKILKELRKTGIPIVNKCKDEVQLANKASKLVSLLSNTIGMSSDSDQVKDLFSTQPSGLSNGSFGSNNNTTSSNSTGTNQVEDLFSTQDIDLFSTNNNNLTTSTSLLSSTSSVQISTGNRAVQDPVDVKVNEFDLFFNTTDTQTHKSTSVQPLSQTQTFPQLVTTNVSDSSNSNYSSGISEGSVNKNEQSKVDFFDFDNFAFNKPTSVNSTSDRDTNNYVTSNLTNPVQRSVDPALQPVVSNIDNNLDLFDNTDFTNFLDRKPDDLFTTQNNQTNNTNNSNFDLI